MRAVTNEVRAVTADESRRIRTKARAGTKVRERGQSMRAGRYERGAGTRAGCRRARGQEFRRAGRYERARAMSGGEWARAGTSAEDTGR